MSKSVHDLYVRTQHDEREYISVMEIFYYDDDGDEIVHSAATGCCEALVTCGDMPERFEVLEKMVKSNLKSAGIKYGRFIMDDDPSG
jgi:hypothetical protein